MKLSNEVAIVSGGAGGMGAAHVRALVAEGARVLVGDVADDAGRQVAEEVGENAAFVHLNVASEEDWAEAVRLAGERFGPVSVLVNNAGIATGAHLPDYTLASWEEIIAVNLTGVFLGMRAVSRGMQDARHGSIINTSSIMGFRGNVGTYGYTASKWGIRGLTKCAALELAPYGVRVNTIFPGLIDTAMSQAPVHDTAQGLAHVPLGRAGTPEEVAKTVVFLASEDSAFTTGGEFVLDGGQSSTLPSSLPDK